MSNRDSQLFRSAADHYNAWVDWDPHNWHRYIEGYRRAADLLATLATEYGVVGEGGSAHLQYLTNPNYLIYPTVFLYRHAIEVCLKSILESGWQYLEVEREVPWKHGLLPLWQEARKVIDQVLGFEQDDTDVLSVDDVIRQLHERDPGSTTFRYPTGSTDKVELPENEMINLGQVKRILGKTYEMLDAAVTGISHMLHAKKEQLAARADYHE